MLSKNQIIVRVVVPVVIVSLLILIIALILYFSRKYISRNRKVGNDDVDDDDDDDSSENKAIDIHLNIKNALGPDCVEQLKESSHKLKIIEESSAENAECFDLICNASIKFLCKNESKEKLLQHVEKRLIIIGNKLDEYDIINMYCNKPTNKKGYLVLLGVSEEEAVMKMKIGENSVSQSEHVDSQSNAISGHHKRKKRRRGNSYDLNTQEERGKSFLSVIKKADNLIQQKKMENFGTVEECVGPKGCIIKLISGLKNKELIKEIGKEDFVEETKKDPDYNEYCDKFLKLEIFNYNVLYFIYMLLYCQKKESDIDIKTNIYESIYLILSSLLELKRLNQLLQVTEKKLIIKDTRVCNQDKFCYKEIEDKIGNKIPMIFPIGTGANSERMKNYNAEYSNFLQMELIRICTDTNQEYYSLDSIRFQSFNDKFGVHIIGSKSVKVFKNVTVCKDVEEGFKEFITTIMFKYKDVFISEALYRDSVDRVLDTELQIMYPPPIGTYMDGINTAHIQQRTHK